ncbi:OmpA family protein [Ferrimonas pelagia]|uniref:OmpA-like domain-containing protein n=1 Tax=Ferrimonas pelagia TaxID=1177826 RepID=A0ABP9FJG8_9GAMM
MKTLSICVLSLIPGLCLAQANHIQYCGQADGGGHEYVVRINTGSDVLPHQGQFMQIETTTSYQPTQALASAHARMAVSRDDCREYGEMDDAVHARVYFDFDRSQLTRSSITILNRVAEREHAQSSSLQLTGHTDAIGSPEYNQALGLRRSHSVNDHLVQQGINAERLTSDSKGMSQPIAPNNTEAGRSQNRRVEIIKKQ